MSISSIPAPKRAFPDEVEIKFVHSSHKSLTKIESKIFPITVENKYDGGLLLALTTSHYPIK